MAQNQTWCTESLVHHKVRLQGRGRVFRMDRAWAGINAEAPRASSEQNPEDQPLLVLQLPKLCVPLG